ncbi:peptidyl-alpha-hydroxyglycine alpha-amidating lyase 1 [Periplaneta americana]|uniref:peptidyl-alpha-hydroxyglycine alpha-amidating lyase 1 n=1 Tax=Periplaneta americana TaxID=6978 RepID=UPI0037E82126
MTDYLGLVIVFALSSVQLSSTDYKHDVKRHLWRNGADAVGTLNSHLKHMNVEDVGSADYGSQPWTPEERLQSIKSTKNSSYNVVENWPDPSKKLGQLSAVSFDADGNVVVFHRGDRVWDSNTFLTNNVYNQRGLGPIVQPTIVVFNASSGLVVQEWGTNIFYLPHGLTVDANNNVWVTDVALHQVFKFPPGGGTSPGKPLLTLGVAFVPGNDDAHFCKPTAVAVMSNGDFFVSDGYCNSRIMKYSMNGKLLMQWGRNSFEGNPLLNENLPPYEFYVPHALALAEDKEMLCVADRENGRILCFNCHNGSFIIQFRSLKMGSRLFSVAYSSAQGGLLYVVNGPEIFGGGFVSGFIISLSEKQLLGSFIPNEHGFSNPHDVAVSSDGSQVYVVELNPYKVWKFVNGYVNNTNTASRTITNSSSTTVKSILPQHGLNFSKLQIVEMPLESSPASTIATVIGIVVGIMVVVAIVIFAAVMKMRKRGGSFVLGTDDLEYSQLVE